jgi:hypothetical protein
MYLKISLWKIPAVADFKFVKWVTPMIGTMPSSAQIWAGQISADMVHIECSMGEYHYSWRPNFSHEMWIFPAKFSHHFYNPSILRVLQIESLFCNSYGEYNDDNTGQLYSNTMTQANSNV